MHNLDTYKCKAKHIVNTTSSSATLHVYGKFNDNDDDDDADRDDHVTLTLN